MKKWMMLLALALLAGWCFGQNTLVVVPLQNRGERSLSADVETITELLGNAVARTRRFDVVDRAALEDVMREHKFQMDDWSSDSKSVEMGRVLNANYIVRGQVSRLGKNLIVTARILDVNTARILGTAEMSLQSTNEAFNKMENFVRDLTRDVRSESNRLPQSRPVRRSTQRSSDNNEPADDAWKNKWVYLGGVLGGGYNKYTYTVTRTEYYSYYDPYSHDYYYFSEDYEDSYDDTLGLAFFGFQADFWPLKFLALEADLGFGVFGEEIKPIIPLLVKFGGRPGPMELSANIGYTIGAGFTVGTTVGVRAGPGVFSIELFFIPEGDIGQIFIVTAGYKVGLGNKK